MNPNVTDADKLKTTMAASSLLFLSIREPYARGPWYTIGRLSLDLNIRCFPVIGTEVNIHSGENTFHFPGLNFSEKSCI